jgi:hypothetical protein
MKDASRGEERTAAFRALAKYLFGGNESGTAMQMTTPVISSSDTMQFVLPVESIAEAPKPPADSDVTLREVGETFCGLRGRSSLENYALAVLGNDTGCYVSWA